MLETILYFRCVLGGVAVPILMILTLYWIVTKGM